LVAANEKLEFPRLLSALLKLLIDVCAHETNKLYILATGRLLPLIDLLEILLVNLSSAPYVDNEGFGLLRQVMFVVSVCLGLSTKHTIQIQARDDTLGYLVNLGSLSKLEHLIISVIRLLSCSCALKVTDSQSTKGTGNQGIMDHLQILDVSVTLIEAVTMCHEIGGKIKTAIDNQAVMTNLVSALDEGRLVGLVPLLSTIFLDVKICKFQMATDSQSIRERDFIKSSGGFDELRQGRVGIDCAVKSLRALNNMAVLDLSLVQRSLGSVVICSEFSHVALEILESCGNSQNFGNLSPRNCSSPTCEMLHELILLIGHMAFSITPDVPSPFSGWRNGIKMLQQLCDLPISYFASPALREILLPTLVTATFKNPALLDAMRNQVSVGLLATYLDHYILCMHNRGLDPNGSPFDGLSKEWARLPSPSVPSRFHLGNRFPPTTWSDARDWFRQWGDKPDRDDGA
jgi:hypothetical protein